jgi:formylglycine-generating enzyme required for sulfatase activity
MNTDDRNRSLGDAATFAGSSKRRSSDASLGDEQTLGGGDAAGIDTVFDDIEVVDLAARYKTEGTLGHGGMGEVLLALDTRLDRKVAIKRILGEAAHSKTAVSRFLTEAKAIAALNHPNVVQIYDYGRAADGPFLIMEYVDGSSLLDRCRDGAFPLEQAVDLACQLCDGLAKAHDLGIVHRDIKPANVLLTKDGLPKLTDFGLAKAEAADHQMTMTGAVLGTPDFMPPEQRKDAALVDHRSDLWSLAATLYEMVTGRSPKIIRFDLLPPSLTGVLGKALEDSKDDRYQSAREFRDALKTSLATSAPAAAELGEGQCPACGVKNESSRRFCRGCGESLEAPCLSCSKPMPMWEEICGQCGTKQAPLIEGRRGEMAARQAEAEGLLKDYDFDQAEQITVALRDESDSRLNQLVPWATDFVAKIGKAREAQLAQAGERLAEALKHEASFDYPSAIQSLEQVPEILRNQSLAGHTESVAGARFRVEAKQSNVETLESLIKTRIAARELGGLLPKTEKLRELRPDRADVEKLCEQLKEREQKLAAQRDEAVRLARGHLDAKDYESAIAVLRKVDRSVETPDVSQLRDAAETNIKGLQNLLREISQAVSQKQLDGLIPKVQAALAIKPGHAELSKLCDSLRARESKVAAGIQELLSQADAASRTCQFDKAVAVLQRVPEERRNSEVADLLDRCKYLALTKAGVLAGFEALPKIADLSTAEGVNLSGLAMQGRSYLREIATHGLNDRLIEQWCDKCETAAEKREAAEAEASQARENLRRILIGSGAAAALLLSAAISLWIRSSWRVASLNAALAKADWHTVLRLSPDNVPAIVGLAMGKLGSDPPDIAGAFDDLGRAEKIAPGNVDIRATRAVACALSNNLPLATQELDAATALGADAQSLELAREFITTGYTSQATQALDRGDLSLATNALNSLRRLGAKPDIVRNGWLRYAEICVAKLSYDGLTLACREADELGLSSDQQVGFWRRLGETAAAKANFKTAGRAYEMAATIGLKDQELSAVRAQAHLMHAAEMIQSQDVAGAVTTTLKAMDLDEVASLSALRGAAYVGLNAALIEEVHRRFLSAVTDNDIPVALKLVSQACKIDSELATWVADELGARREQFKAVPPSELADLPMQAIEMLPVDLLTRLPVSELVRLSASTLSALPSQKLEELPDDTLVSLNVDVIASLKPGVLRNVIRRRGGLWPEESGEISVRRALGKALLDQFRKSVSSSAHAEAREYCELLLFCDPGLIQQLIDEGSSFDPGNLPAFADEVLEGLARKQITLEKPIRNSVGMVLQQLPGWVFLMGDAQNGPIHPVVIKKPFFIGVTEVTNAEFEKVMGPGVINRCQGRVGRYGAEGTAYCGMRPACVSWQEAVQFCEKLSAQRVEKTKSRTYRLPTEAEWEFACRAGSRTSFCYGDAPENLGEYANFNNSTNIDTVGSRKPNAWGLFDMHGNAAEWCWDWLGTYEERLCMDPSGPETGERRVHRGGSASWSADGCTSAMRFSDLPIEEKGYIGFRVVMVQESK